MTPQKGGIKAPPPKQPAAKPAPQSQPTNPHGNAGYHPSTKGYEHSGATHSSDDR